MPNISQQEFTRLRIMQIENMIRPLGWILAAQDQSGDPIKLTLTFGKQEMEAARERFNNPPQG